GRRSALTSALSQRERESAQAAKPSGAPAELREGCVQLFAPKIGPACWCRIVLGVRRLPQQKVTQAHLATGADDQVELGQTSRVEVLFDQLLSDLLGCHAALDDPPHGAGNLMARAVVEGDVQHQARVVARELDRGPDALGEARVDAVEGADVTNADVVP